MRVALRGMNSGLGATSASAVQSAGAGLLQVAMYTGPAAPFVAAAGAMLEFISAAFLTPNYGKEYASAFVNEIEADYLRPNVARWRALPADQKTQSAQAAALNVFTQGWNAVIQYCSNPALTSGGIHCIDDRQRGGKYDWWNYFYDPIANDPNVQPDVIPNSNLPSGAGTSPSVGGVSSSPLLWASLLAGIALFLGRGD